MKEDEGNLEKKLDRLAAEMRWTRWMVSVFLVVYFIRWIGLVPEVLLLGVVALLAWGAYKLISVSCDNAASRDARKRRELEQLAAVSGNQDKSALLP